MAIMTFIVRFLAGVGVGGLLWQTLIMRSYRHEALELEKKLLTLREEVIAKTQAKLVAKAKA